QWARNAANDRSPATYLGRRKRLIERQNLTINTVSARQNITHSWCPKGSQQGNYVGVRRQQHRIAFVEVSAMVEGVEHTSSPLDRGQRFYPTCAPCGRDERSDDGFLLFVHDFKPNDRGQLISRGNAMRSKRATPANPGTPTGRSGCHLESANALGAVDFHNWRPGGVAPLLGRL